MRELWVGVTTARPMPAPDRAISSTQKAPARPVMRPKIAQMAAPATAIRTRGSRSA